MNSTTTGPLPWMTNASNVAPVTVTIDCDTVAGSSIITVPPRQVREAPEREAL
jgi:hypothetical protein